MALTAKILIPGKTGFRKNLTLLWRIYGSKEMGFSF